MRKIYFLVFCFLTFGVLSAQEKLSKEEQARREKNIQAGNPFAKFGYKGKVATLSKGKYLEVHDLDSIVTIGSIRYHVDKIQIVGNIVIDTTDIYARPIGDTPSRWLSPDPLSEEFPDWTPYRYGFNNPIRYNDPTGLLESTDVTLNADGSYTVVNAQNDGDNNIYVVNNDTEKTRTGEVIGQTQNPWDFMKTNDKTGEFKGYADVTFSLNNLPDGNALIDKYSTEFSFIAGGLQDSKIATAALAGLSRNTGRYDIKSSFSNSTGGKYTAMSFNGKITTARTVGNILFGQNMRAINTLSLDQTFIPAGAFYQAVMPAVGAYNQYQNDGNGYNSGFPFYGEHTYSGTGIYTGYFGVKPTKR